MFVKPQNQLMSDLQKERFAINKQPFSKTVIDHFGFWTHLCKNTQENNIATRKQKKIWRSCLHAGVFSKEMRRCVRYGRPN